MLIFIVFFWGQLFDWMQQNGKVSDSTYSSCIKFVGAKSVSKALEIYQSIPDESTTKTNVYICNSILSCLVKNGKLDSCIKLFDQMKRDGLKPDVVTYNTVMSLLYANATFFCVCIVSIICFFFFLL